MNSNSVRNYKEKTGKLVLSATFCALAYAVTLLIRIDVLFLTFDAKDAVITVAGLLLGPVYSIVISLVTTLIESITVGNTQFWGLLMDFLSTAVFSATCALIYKYKKNMKGAVIGLVSSVIAMTAFMLLFNLFIVPLYTPDYTTVAVAKLIPTLFLPFNLTKGVMNAAIVLVLYKPVSIAVKASKILTGKSSGIADPETSDKKKSVNLAFSVTLTAVGLVAIAICAIVFFVVMNGSFSAF